MFTQSQQNAAKRMSIEGIYTMKYSYIKGRISKLKQQMEYLNGKYKIRIWGVSNQPHRGWSFDRAGVEAEGAQPCHRKREKSNARRVLV